MLLAAREPDSSLLFASSFNSPDRVNRESKLERVKPDRGAQSWGPIVGLRRNRAMAWLGRCTKSMGVCITEATKGSLMIHGLRTAIYPTPDLAAGKAWYSKVLGCQPYFDQPFYVGFSVGGFELGLIPDAEPGSAGVRVYWGVDDAAGELKRLLALGGTVHEEAHNVGGEIVVASVHDPFGNLLCLIQNPYFKLADVR